MDATTIKGKFLAAVCALGAGEGTIEQRLRVAYEDHLRPVLARSDLPDAVQRDCLQLMDELAALFRASEVDSRRAVSLAKRIVVLYDRLAKDVH